jgi:glycosyltransferase involved in cell wall biosynthesis
MTIYLYVQYFPLATDLIQNGVAKAVHGLAAGLADCGESVTVLSEGPQAVTRQTQFGYVHHCFRSAKTRPSIQLARDLKQFIKQQVTTQDLFILNGAFHLNVYALARSLAAQAIPYVMAPHLSYDKQMFAKSAYRKHLYWYLCERYVLQSAQAVQVLDRRQAVWLKQRGITTSILEVQNGFEPQAIVPRSSGSEQSVSHPAQLLFFGRLCTHIKGLDLLLKAFATLDDPGYPAPELVLQGPDPGDLARLIQTAQALGVTDRVQFRAPDYVTPPPQIMAQSDIVCLPSRSEGFGLAALEGMLAGRVLLVSETAGIAKHVLASRCGVVVKPNPEAIQAGLNWLLQCRDEWPAMGWRGQQQAIAHLPWRQIAQQARPQYQALIDAAHGTTAPLPLAPSDRQRVALR